MMAFRFIARARSSMLSISAFCCATGRPARLGQSMLATVETQAARNSRGAAGGRSGALPTGAGGWTAMDAEGAGGTGLAGCSTFAGGAQPNSSTPHSASKVARRAEKKQDGAVCIMDYFLPNSGSIFSSAAAIKAGTVATHTQIKKYA